MTKELSKHHAMWILSMDCVSRGYCSNILCTYIMYGHRINNSFLDRRNDCNKSDLTFLKEIVTDIYCYFSTVKQSL